MWEIASPSLEKLLLLGGSVAGMGWGGVGWGRGGVVAGKQSVMEKGTGVWVRG